MVWIQHRDPSRPTGRPFWDKLISLLGHDQTGHPRLTGLLADDAPRYVPPPQVRANRGVCEGPRLRPRRLRPADPNTIVHVPPGHIDPITDERTCGAPATINVVGYDMNTGWANAHWFCCRHQQRAEEVRAQITTAGDPPEPIPNRGGILPCYYTANWQHLYSLHRPGWRPPHHGLCADDWPTPTHRHIPRPPRLTVIAALG